jgi:ABC-type polar amino acid transport system ATPase subunit
MPDFPYHRQLSLSNFTVFADTTFEFSPGVNAFIGENGSGKTHMLKAMYAYQRPLSRNVPSIEAALRELFQTKNAADLIRSKVKRGAITEVRGLYGDSEWAYAIQKTNNGTPLTNAPQFDMIRPVFIPAIDMMGHTLQFTQAYDQVQLDFDLTCYDLVTLLNLAARDTQEMLWQHPVGRVSPLSFRSPLENLLGGELEQDDTGRFYLRTGADRIAMPLVAEGLRKIATLVQLQRNGWIRPGMTLYWDEPEANLNPILMDELIAAILTLAREGVQVLLTTHSYVILKELDLQAVPEDRVRFFSLHGTKAGTQVTVADELAALDPNPILQQYGSLYDRDIRRATGRKHR